MKKPLSPRQNQVAALVAQGFTDKEIAGRIGFSSHTVNFHLRKAFEKLGISSRVELAMKWRDNYESSSSLPNSGAYVPRKKRVHSRA